MRLDEKGLEAAARAVHASTAFQPAAGPWTGSLQVSEKQAVGAAKAAVEAYFSALQAEPGACEHEWFDISNKHVLPPAFSCSKCGLVKGTEAEPLYIQWPWLQTTTPMPATVSEAMVELAAKAAYYATRRNKPFERLSAFQRNASLLEARAALETALAAGGRG